jgi:hypothetical protein
MLRIADYAQPSPQQSSFPCLSNLPRDRQPGRKERLIFKVIFLKERSRNFLKKSLVILWLLLKAMGSLANYRRRFWASVAAGEPVGSHIR